MKRLGLAVLFLTFVTTWYAVAETPGTPAKTTVTSEKALTPLPDEKTLKISESPGTAASAPARSADITIWDFVKMVVILAFVLAMIWGVVWFLRRLSGQGPGTDSPIKILHTQGLGGNKVLQVVEVADQILLLGLGDGGIRLVKDLTGTEAGDTFRLTASEGRSQKGTPKFTELLGTLLGLKPRIRPDLREPVENSSDFLKKQRERLKKL